jgi:hypothetical protein
MERNPAGMNVRFQNETHMNMEENSRITEDETI